VYLSGPIQNAECPNQWRIEVEQKYNNIEFLNPFDLGLDPLEDQYELVWRELDAIRHVDFVLVKYTPGVETYGTPIEMFWAWINSIPVVVWTEEHPEDLPVFARMFSDAIKAELDACIQKGWEYCL